MNDKIDKKEKKEPAVLTEIRVKGFKCFRDEAKVELRPLTILAGANSSGKTSIMQPLLLMKQTLLSRVDPPDPLLLDGSNVQFSRVEQMFWQDNEGIESELMIGLKDSNGDYVEQYFKRTSIDELLNDRVEYGYGNTEKKWKIIPNMTDADIRENLSDYYQLAEQHFQKLKIKTNYSTTSFHFYIGIQVSGDGIDHKKDVSYVLGKQQFYPMENFGGFIERMFHLAGLRGNPQRLYPKLGTLSFLGQYHPYTASVIYSWQDKTRTTFNRKNIDNLHRILLDMKLAYGTEVRETYERQLEILVNRIRDKTEKNDLVNIADVGFGVSQVLPVLVALIEANPGQIVYIEQPELHLHPRAQVILAEIIAEASKRGVIVVVETHSAMLLLGLRRVVVKGLIDPSLIKLHWFKRDEESGASQVISNDIGDNGALGDWPEDFTRVEMDFEDEYLSYSLD